MMLFQVLNGLTFAQNATNDLRLAFEVEKAVTGNCKKRWPGFQSACAPHA